MDLLRNLGSAAASSLLQKSGITLPYTLGDIVTEYNGKSIWTLYNATKKDDSSPISVFYFDGSVPQNRQNIPFAKNALRKLRTTRHPDILKFIDVVEQGDSMWIMTERVRPLRGVLFSWGDNVGKGKEKNKEREEWTIWGLHRIAIALAFLNTTCVSTHGNIALDSIFLSPSGEWRLSGFEVLGSTKDENPIIFTQSQHLRREIDISSPEVKKSGWNVLKDYSPGVSDAYALGILLHTVFNISTTPPPTVHPPHTAPTASSRGDIPTNIFPLFKKLLNPSPKARLTCETFLNIGMGVTAGMDGSNGRFFADNHLVQVCSQLEGFPLASEGEKTEFLRALKDSASSFPPEFAINHVIPALISSLEHGGASAAVVLPLIFQLAKLAEDDSSSVSSSRRSYHLDTAQYNAKILAPVIKLFASPDRGTRMALLEALPDYESRLDGKMVQDGIWPHLQTGFSDTVPVIREATVRAISMIGSKLSTRVMNNDLLRHLARAQSDQEPSIRTNTCILIARLAPNLAVNTKKKVLVPAFTKAIKDPFVHARVAGLVGLTACIDCFDMEDVATRVIGSIGGALIDKEKIVRDQAFKSLDIYKQKLEVYAATLPETALSPEGSTGPVNGVTFSSSGAQVGQGQGGALVSSAAGAAGALASWAFSSVSSRLVTSDLNTKMASSAPVSSAPASPLPGSFPSTTSTTKAPARASVTPSARASPSSSVRAPKNKGMALGSKLGAKANGHAALMAELEKEMKDEEVEVADAWDDDDPYAAEDSTKNNLGDDLIDVNADQDDWTAFESAPAPSVSSAAKSPSKLHPSSAAPAADNPWANSTDDLASVFSKPVSYPSLSTEPVLQPKTLGSNSRLLNMGSTGGQSTPSEALSTVPSTWQSPVTSPKPTDDWGGFGDGEMVSVEDKSRDTPSAAPANLSGLSKEAKAAEMARRREERKARIAQLKEQKKGGT